MRRGGAAIRQSLGEASVVFRMDSEKLVESHAALPFEKFVETVYTDSSTSSTKLLPYFSSVNLPSLRTVPTCTTLYQSHAGLNSLLQRLSLCLVLEGKDGKGRGGEGLPKLCLFPPSQQN